MDGRTKWYLAAIAAVGILWAGSAGRATAGIFSKEAKHRPKAATCVAWAVCQEEQANKPDLTTSEKNKILDNARRGYQEALEIDPTYLPAQVGLARVYMNMNLLEKSMETYHRALQKYPKDSSLWFGLGVCHCRNKQWELAIRSFQKAQQGDPENRTVNQTMGFCQARAGHLKESIATLSKVMSPVEAHFTVARMMHYMKRPDLCKQFLAETLRMDPNFAPARRFQASIQPNTRPIVQIRFEESN